MTKAVAKQRKGKKSKRIVKKVDFLYVGTKHMATIKEGLGQTLYSTDRWFFPFHPEHRYRYGT